MSMPIATRRRLIRHCDPLRALPPGDPMYVELDAEPSTRGDRPWVELLRETILLSDDSCQLFSGFSGTGKTTELLRLKGQLEGEPDDPSHVVYIDFGKYIDVYSPITIIDVVRVLAYCMDRAAAIAERKDPESEPGYLRRFFEFVSQHDVELQKIGFGAYGGSLMLEVKNNPSFRERVEEAVHGRFQAFVEEARRYIERAVARILNASASRAQRVVVIADDLEKITPLREDDRPRMEGSVETLFLSHADLLKLQSCHVIYTFPLWLRFRAAHLGALYGREPLVLPMVRIAGSDGGDDEAGLGRLRLLIERRVEALETIFGGDPETQEATLGALIRASGGYPRDLLRMVRTLLLEARSLPVSVAEVQRVIDGLARTYEDTILGEYVELLARVHRTHALPRENAAERALAGYLFERWLILAYRNGAEWFDLHPLVRRSPRVQRGLAESAV